MLAKCERCKKLAHCTFYGTPSDPERDKVQNGEWLCRPCVPLRRVEVDSAIENMKRVLRGGQ